MPKQLPVVFGGFIGPRKIFKPPFGPGYNEANAALDKMLAPKPLPTTQDVNMRPTPNFGGRPEFVPQSTNFNFPPKYGQGPAHGLPKNPGETVIHNPTLLKRRAAMGQTI